jgi:hypothetical protein
LAIRGGCFGVKWNGDTRAPRSLTLAQGGVAGLLVGALEGVTGGESHGALLDEEEGKGTVCSVALQKCFCKKISSKSIKILTILALDGTLERGPTESETSQPRTLAAAGRQKIPLLRAQTHALARAGSLPPLSPIALVAPVVSCEAYKLTQKQCRKGRPPKNKSWGPSKCAREDERLTEPVG